MVHRNSYLRELLIWFRQLPEMLVKIMKEKIFFIYLDKIL